MVLILFRNVSLCYGDAAKDQVGSSAPAYASASSKPGWCDWPRGTPTKR